MEHQVRYSSLYQERGEIVKHTYSEIIKLGKRVKKARPVPRTDWIKTENNFAIRDRIFQFEELRDQTFIFRKQFM